jgi:hypothetical protein
MHRPVLHGIISFGTAAAGRRRRAALIVGHVERAVQWHRGWGRCSVAGPAGAADAKHSGEGEAARAVGQIRSDVSAVI